MSNKQQKITWEQLTAIEPELNTLYREIKAVKDDRRKRSFCANSVWYGYHEYAGRGFKRDMIYLVGHLCHKPKIKTMEAYDVAYRKLYDALPDCRNCVCMAVEKYMGFR